MIRRYSLVLALLLISCSSPDNAIERIAVKPDIRLTTRDNKINKVKYSENRHTILVFFDPDCDNCKMEIKSILNGIEELFNEKLYFISIRPLKKNINEELYQRLFSYPNTIVAYDTDDAYGKLFHSIVVPLTVIYGRNGTLKKIIRGAISNQDLNNLLK